MRAKIFLMAIMVVAMLMPTSALADGIIIPEPPVCDPGPCPPIPHPVEQLAIRYHRVVVTIEDQFAVIHVDQVFYNPNDWTVEGTYIFPIPLGAAINAFTLWIDGKPVNGEVLDADQARQRYEQVVRQLRDPALLEYAGRNAVQARIYPIPPRGERRIELEYTQVLPADNGLVSFIYPLNTEKFSTLPLEEVSVSVEVSASQPIRAVYSPSHKVAINRENEYRVRIGYEESNVIPEKDFALYYSLGEEQAFHLMTYRDPSDLTDPDGFFMLLLAPRPMQPKEVISKDVLMVLDRSGSMDGEKFRQAKEAIRYILQHLNPGDRFNIITFSTGVDSLAGRMRPVSDVNNAVDWMDRTNAEGSTDINWALLEASTMVDRERPVYLIFLTDGLPTEGIVDSQQILDNFQEAAPSNLRVFPFGVGYDVDTFLLDSLAQNHHGRSSYVLPDERLDEDLSAFYEKISTPVLTDLSLDFGKILTYDIYPQPLPDLFTGSQVLIVGRYRQSGESEVILSGFVNGERHTFRYPEMTFSMDTSEKNGSDASIPRLWATRKIGYLLNQIRLQGPDKETIDQIVKLSIRYGIVTPYTSYLVTEEMPLGTDEQERIASEQYNQLQAQPPLAASGQEAVQKAVIQGSLSQAEGAAELPDDYTDIVALVGSRTFVYKDSVWVDTAFDPENMPTVKVGFLSDDYFVLAGARSELAAAFALGQAVIAVSDGIAYEVVKEDEATEPITITSTASPVPTERPDVTEAPTIGPSQFADHTISPGRLACAASLLPLIVLPFGLLIARRRYKK